MSTIVSAPGKVLLAGGYLVLDRQYTALVFGLSSRIHVLVEDVNTASGVELAEIIVQSPQFRDAVWNYGYNLTHGGGGMEVTQLQGGASTTRNPFVEVTLLYTLTYISTILKASTIKPTKITILADNDYYSHAPSNPSARFSSFGVRLSEAHKTGLGSSAALVTSLTASLLTHYLPKSAFDLSTELGKSYLHNLAQIAHCAAQGKVGSGFDVAAAVYGTCIYRRFSPSVLSSLGEPKSPGFEDRVKALVEDADRVWDVEISKEGVSLPKGMSLVMCDVDCGSQTVGMVKQVLAWKAKEKEDAERLWNELQTYNVSLGQKLASGEKEALPAAIEEIRKRIREMSEKSGIPIEPKEQTELLDAITKNVDGVIGGVVPGAGGYDAIVLLIKNDVETLRGIEAFLKRWSAEKKSNVKLLESKGELEGARNEDAKSYVTALG